LSSYHDSGTFQQIQGGQQIEDHPNLLSSLNLLEEQASLHLRFHSMRKPAGNSAVAGVVSQVR
jgi:hypothetical protein